MLLFLGMGCLLLASYLAYYGAGVAVFFLTVLGVVDIGVYLWNKADPP
jgi:hypothetical protein